jgi:hypothetical protein
MPPVNTAQLPVNHLLRQPDLGGLLRHTGEDEKASDSPGLWCLPMVSGLASGVLTFPVPEAGSNKMQNSSRALTLRKSLDVFQQACQTLPILRTCRMITFNGRLLP